ncbi:hypothetical protein J4E80_004457 [Alternaria sp. BMP 0032]|nr:hypothetical protein J4E80_004457 [Alternaria sp. BMP 0032]
MSDRAERLMTKLKKEFGSIPLWETALVQTRFEAGDSEWDITRKYYQHVHDYSYYRPLARMLHRRCKKEIGEFPSITEDMVRKWILLKYWSDVEVMAEYQRQFDEAKPEERRAKKLLAEMRRDFGHCTTVNEVKILRWMEGNLTDEMVKEKYKADIEQSKLVSRAKALQYRLGDEVSRELSVSVPDLLKQFKDNLTDGDIVKQCQEDASKP